MRDLSPSLRSGQALKKASLGIRLCAAVLDVLLTGFPTACLCLFLHRVWNFPLPGLTSQPGLATGVGIGLALGFGLNGRLLARRGQTLGKALCRICIRGTDGCVPPLRDSFWRRYLPIALVLQVPVAGVLAVLVDVLFAFSRERCCLHDRISGTRVVVAAPGPAEAAATGQPSSPGTEAMQRGGKEAALPAPPQVERCPYCAELTSIYTCICRGCGRNPFDADPETANQALGLDDLRAKASRLRSDGLDKEALQVLLFLTHRFPNHKEAWQELVRAPDVDAGMRAEAQRQLQRIRGMSAT